MKTIFSKILVPLFIFISISSQSQNGAEKQKQIENLLNSKEFIFIAQIARPSGYPSVSLSSSTNFFKMHPDKMEGHLPYFGRAYSGTPYGGDSGIRFNAAPSDYKLKKNKKNYEITAAVKGETENYKVTLTVDFDGFATLHIYSNKRSSISYSGNISSTENKIEDQE